MSRTKLLAILFFFSLMIGVFQNCSGMRSTTTTLTSLRIKPLIPQPVETYDPRPRFLFGKADFDGNGVRDSFYLDRNTGHVDVRLFGAFPAGHPYAGIDQKTCSATAWKFVNNPVANQPNLDYCDAVVRPEETWATVNLLDAKNDHVQIFLGHIFDRASDGLLVWDESRLIFAKTQQSPDPIGLRPALKTIMNFKTEVLDLSVMNICQAVNLPPSEMAMCSEQRWKNLARPWEKTVLSDLNGDGLDDIVGVVALDDSDPKANLGLWALTSNRQEDGSIRYSPVFITPLSPDYRGENFLVGDFEGLGTPQIVFTRADKQVLSEIRLGCSQPFAPGPGCARLTTLGSAAVNLDTSIAGTGQISIDEVEAGHFLNSAGSVQLRFRAKRASMTNARYYLLSFSSGNPVVSPWNCLWQPSTLDPSDANWACLTSNPDPSRTFTRTITGCGGNCRAAIQSALDSPSVRNVILTSGTYSVSGTLNVSTLDANGNQLPQMTKRLMGMGATIVASNPYYSVQANSDGTYTSTPVDPADPAAFDQCREYRAAFDGSNATTALQTRKILSHCGVIQTLGNNITIANLNIDTTSLSQLTASKPLDQLNAGSVIPLMHSILLGYYASGWAWPYLSDGSENKSLMFRRMDMSRPPDENIRLVNLNLQNTDFAGIATYATPMAVRDVVVEDIICRPFSPATAQTLSNCIDLNAPNITIWPFDASYRQFVPFGPPPVENFYVKKGPHAASVCDMAANSQTVRLSGTIGFVLENCRVQKGFMNDGIFLYVTDTGAKLDATLRGDTVFMDLASTPHYGLYNLTKHSFIPARFDANGNELFQDPTVFNDPLITVSGRGMSESVSFNYRTDLAPDILLDPANPARGSQVDYNRRMNTYALMLRKPYQYRETPSQVFIEGLRSQIDSNVSPGSNDSKFRVHIKENLALSGKFICKDCNFEGGGMIMSADLADLWANVYNCINDPVADTHQLTKDQLNCSGTALKAGRSMVPGIVRAVGYDANNKAITATDPNESYAREHGKYFEFINATVAQIYQPNAVVIKPGSWDTSAYTKLPNTAGSFSSVITAP